jgi:hypothetical protein
MIQEVNDILAIPVVSSNAQNGCSRATAIFHAKKSSGSFIVRRTQTPDGRPP